MLRKAVIDDIEDIYNLDTELFIVLSELEPDVYNPVSFPKDYIKAMINSEDSDYIIVEEDEKVIGYCLIEKRAAPCERFESLKKDEFAYIDEVVILPEYRMKGYGKELMDCANEWAKEKGLKTIELNALAKNYSACAFYERFGFREYQIKYRKEVE